MSVVEAPTKTSIARIWRKQQRMNQTEFWKRVGVAQSAGSRYESGYPPPESVSLLLELAYGPRPLQALARLRETPLADLTKAIR